MNISAKTSRGELAAIVVSKLREHNINSAVLVGGSVVSLYTDNKYQTSDLDFICSADHKMIAQALFGLGFKSVGKDFVHPKTDFTVEFPTGPLGIGNDVPITSEGSMTINGVEIQMLSPTQSVMDRLISFFIYNDRQCLDQAVWVAQRHEIDIARIEAWAKREGHEEKLAVFLSRCHK